MRSTRFCTDAINILRQHEVDGVIEIKRMDILQIYALKERYEASICVMLDDPNEHVLWLGLAEVGCKSLLSYVGFHERGTGSPSRTTLSLIRKVSLMLDMAVVSYVRSHCSGF